MFTVPGAERQRETGTEKKERVGMGWQCWRESKSLFPEGKVICKGIVPKSVTKGKMQFEGTDEKWRSRMEWELKIEKKTVMGVFL